MRRAAFLIAAATVLTPAAFADIDRCQEPFGPVLPKEETVTRAQLTRARAEVQVFIKDSDAYQDCLLSSLNDPDAKLKEPEHKALSARVDRRIQSNQREKEAIGAAYNRLVAAVNKREGAAPN